MRIKKKKMKMKKIIVNIFLITFFSIVNYAYSSSIGATKIDKSQPLNITADKVEIIRDKSQLIFVGDVKAIQDKFTLYADKMVVKYKETENKKMDIESIQTDKNVKFTNETVIAIGDEGFYDTKKNIIVMKKNIKVTEKGITVFADEFVYDVNTGKTNIIGNKQQNERVTIILDNIENLK